MRLTSSVAGLVVAIVGSQVAAQPLEALLAGRALTAAGAPRSAFAEERVERPGPGNRSWRFAFFKAPKPVGNGLCAASITRVSFWPREGSPPTQWHPGVYQDVGYRVVGPLGAPGSDCGTGPIAPRYDPLPPDRTGAFRGPSPARTWQGVERFRAVAAAAKRGGPLPFRLTCDDGGVGQGPSCDSPAAILGAYDAFAISQVRECDIRADNCLVVNLRVEPGGGAFWEVEIVTPSSGLAGGRVAMIYGLAPMAPE